MGLLGDDKRQDEQIAALEEQIAALEDQVRMLTETVQSNLVDLIEGRIALLALQAQIHETVSAADVDPSIVQLNEELTTAKDQLEEATVASETLHQVARDAFETLRNSVRLAVWRGSSRADARSTSDSM